MVLIKPFRRSLLSDGAPCPTDLEQPGSLVTRSDLRPSSLLLLRTELHMSFKTLEKNPIPISFLPMIILQAFSMKDKGKEGEQGSTWD